VKIAFIGDAVVVGRATAIWPQLQALMFQ